MPLAQAANGSQLAVIGTTHTLATLTSGKTSRLIVGAPAAFVAGEFVELDALLKVLTGSTAVSSGEPATFEGRGVAHWIYSLPFDAVHSIAWTLKQTAGTGRTFEWSVVTLQ